MKNYSDFIKEEIDLRGNKGIPDNFMSSADRQASSNLNLRVDDPRQMQQFGGELMQAAGRAAQLVNSGVNREQLQERLTKLETLARNIILQAYGEILEASPKPVVLDIKLINPGTVNREIPEINNIPAQPNQNQARQQQQQLQQRQQQQQQQQNGEAPQEEVVTDADIKDAVDKKKLLNVLTQGEAKATKSIIQYSNLVEPALTEIFGEASGRQILAAWLATTEAANKLDWVMPLEMKSQMMKDMPQGMAGACQVKWEKDENEEEGQEQGEEGQEGQNEAENFQDEAEMVGDQTNFDRITIKAVGIDFPMLVHEAIKGIYQLLQSGSIKTDSELAKIIAKNTSSFSDESQDFRYGVPAQAMFRDFINACKDADKYTNMNTRVYAQLALDKDRGGSFTDAEFLATTKAIFASFDLAPDAGKLEFVLNTEKFAASPAKRNIEMIISAIVDAEQEYEQQMRQWQSDNALSNQSEEPAYSDEDNDSFNDFLADNGMSGAKDDTPATTAPEAQGEYSDEDLSNMRRSDIQELVDDALDASDYEKVGRYSKFLKEGREIYEKELERIYESRKFHGRRKK